MSTSVALLIDRLAACSMLFGRADSPPLISWVHTAPAVPKSIGTVC
jgi:hypothetical protein